jgi:hypothetical protein
VADAVWTPDNSPSQTRQIESMIDKAIEAGKLAAGDRAKWVKAGEVVGSTALRHALDALKADPLVAADNSRNLEADERDYEADATVRLGLQPDEVL